MEQHISFDFNRFTYWKSLVEKNLVKIKELKNNLFVKGLLKSSQWQRNATNICTSYKICNAIIVYINIREEKN